MLTALDGDLKALAAELGAAQDAVKGEVATLTEELIAAKLLIAEKEEIIEQLRREIAPKIKDEAAATASWAAASSAARAFRSSSSLFSMVSACHRIAARLPLPVAVCARFVRQIRVSPRLMGSAFGLLHAPIDCSPLSFEPELEPEPSERIIGRAVWESFI